MLNKQEILDYATEKGNNSALDLLLLLGPDGFDGSANDYELLKKQLRHNIKSSLKEARILSDRYWQRARQLDLYYVACFWVAISDEVNHRVGYFEDINEALQFLKMLKDTYDMFGVPYYIDSNSELCKVDGGLFDGECDYDG